jgi:arylsulfatase A-like enzyme
MYDDRILQMDDMMKKIIVSFKQKGYLRDYVAILTGDHGQLLGEKGVFGHGYLPFIGCLHIPMIFFGSRPLPSFPEIHYADQIDIAPSLVDLAGLQIPFSWQGQSLLRVRKDPWSYHLTPSERPGAEGAVVFYSPKSILIYDRRLNLSEDDPGRLFDLVKDPEEKNDLTAHFDKAWLEKFRNKVFSHFTLN